MKRADSLQSTVNRSHQTRLAERHGTRRPHNEMVEQTNPDGFGCGGQPPRELPVFPRRRRVSGGMVVVEDDRRRVGQERPLQNLARLDEIFPAGAAAGPRTRDMDRVNV